MLIKQTQSFRDQTYLQSPIRFTNFRDVLRNSINVFWRLAPSHTARYRSWYSLQGCHFKMFDEKKDLCLSRLYSSLAVNAIGCIAELLRFTWSREISKLCRIQKYLVFKTLLFYSAVFLLTPI